MTEERDWRNEVLQQADFDKEYGMLAYTLAEVQNAAKPATTAVQNFIAAKIVDRFHAAYDNYAKTYNPNTAYNRARTYGDRINAPMRYDEYFARNRQAYLDVLSQPIDLTLAGMTRDTYGNASPGELFPTAFNQTTVGGAMNWLTMSEVPGMLTSLAKPIYGKQPSLMGQDGKPILDDDGTEVPDPNRQAPLLGWQTSNLPADELNAAWMRGYETIHLYKPGSSNNFTVWFNAQAKKGIEYFREAEKVWRTGSTPMSYAFNDDGGDSDEGGNFVDRNSGEYTDGGMMAGENAGAIGDASRFSTLSRMPMSKSTGAPINVMNAFLNLQTEYGGKDSKQPWTTFNVKTGRYGHNPDAKTLQVWGIDPDSPAAKAGMKEGAFIASLSRLLEDPELPILVDALQNGQPVNIAVRQQNEAGEWVGQVLTIQPGSMAGRGIDDFEEKKPHWIENLADYIDRSSLKGVGTDLYTTSEQYASGMFQDRQGNWHISPMSRTQSEEYSVPVTLSPQALRQFIPLYEEQKKAWKQYDQLYNDHYQRAYQTQLDRYIKANHTGTKLQTPFLDAVREMTLKTLPRDIPRPGTELYQIWQSGQGMLGEIRDFEDNINGAPSSGDFYDRTIEQWDTWASSMERYMNPGVYGTIDPKRLALARSEFSNAGNYLKKQQAGILEGAMSHLRNLNPGGAGTGKTLRRDPVTGELRKVYPEMAMFRPYLNTQREPSTLAPGKTIAQQAAEGEGNQAEIDLAAYSHISNKNALSAFPLGSMNEDEWVDRDGNCNTEDTAEGENTYDSSVLGGEMNTPEMEADLNELEKHWVDKKGNKHYLADNRTRVVDSQGGTPIYDRETREIIGTTPSYGEQRVNSIGQQAALPRQLTGERKLMGPFPAVLHKDQLRGVDATNYDTTDDTIKARQEFDRSHPDRGVDAEMEGASDEIMQGESENRFQQAWNVLLDPQRKGASLSEIVSSAGNAFGFLAHSKADWGQIFQNFSQNDGGKSYSTYYALQDGDRKMQPLADELEANIGGLTRADRKRAVVLSRLGETPEMAADMNLGRNKRQGQYYREALKQVAGEVKKKWGIDLSVGVGEEETFFDQIKDLRKTNAEAFQMVKGAFAPLADQLKASRKWVSQMNTVLGQPQAAPAAGTGNTPAPQRTQQDPGDSHVFRGPDGKGRAMLKWSPNQINEMRRGRRSGIDPVTGEFDPLAMENTPVSAQLAARGGGSSRRNSGFSIPDYEELSPLQNSIAYRHFDAREGDNQRARLGGQVQTYVENYMDRRKRFDLIMPYDADGDQDGTALQSMLQNADAAVRGAFGQGFDIGEMEEVADPDLPAGFVRVGASVRREGEGPEYVNDFAHDPDPGEPPEAPPPPDQNPPGGGNGNNNGQPPTEPPPPNPTGQADHDPSGTPRPSRSNGSGPGRTPKPKPNTDPAAFPMQPGAEGWKMTFTRYNPQTGKGKSVQVWGRKDADGNLGWYERNAQGQMEPLQVNKGWGRIYDEKGALLHEVDRNAREYYDAMNASIVSSDGRNGSSANAAAGNNTSAPARSIIRTPEEWATFAPEAGMMMIDRSRGGGPRHYFAVEDPDNAGQMKWVTSAKHGGIQEDAPNPGWGQIVTKDGQVIADVPQHKYEIYANEQGLARSAENKRLREQARIESEKRNAEIKEQRRIANTTPPPTREGFSASFGRFNNAMWEISGQNVSKFLGSHSPTEFGEIGIGENTKLAAMNEYLGQVTHLYNSYIDRAPASADEILADIMDMTGASEEKARPIAEALFQEHEQVRLSRKAPLAKQNPMKRSMEIAGRLNDFYDSQDIGRGPLGMRSHIQNLAQDVSVRDIDGFHSPSLGEGAFYPYIDAKGEQRYVPRIAIDKVNPQTGETGFQTTANENQIAKGLSWAQNAFNSAFSGELPNSPDAILATLKERMYTAMNKQMKAEVETAVAHGQDRLEAGSAANIIKEIGDHFVQKIVGKVKKGLDETVGEANGGAVAEGTRYDTRIKTLDDLKAKLAADPVFAGEFRGKSAEEIHAGDEMIVYDSDKRSFKVGGSGDDHYGTKSYGRGANAVSSAGKMGPNNGLNMFGTGKWGSLFYGAYLLKREWQMSTGATFAAAQNYGESMEAYAPFMYEGDSLAETDLGFAYRQRAGESFMGKAAFSSWGGFMDIPYRMSQSGNLSAARAVQNLGIAGGLAMGGAITGSMLTAGGMTAAGGALATGGLVLGGAVVAATAGMELYNNVWKPEGAPDVTFSTPIDNFWADRARYAASARRADSLMGATYQDFLKMAGSNPNQTTLSEDAWFKAKLDEMSPDVGGGFASDEQLDQYFTDQERADVSKAALNAKAEKLKSQVGAVSGKTLEDPNTVLKAALLQKHYMGDVDADMLTRISDVSTQLGLGTDDGLTGGVSYATGMGYIPGTADFQQAVYQYALNPDRVDRAVMEYTASRIGSFGSQIQSLMGSDRRFLGMGARIARHANFQNQVQASAYTSMVQGLQMQGASFSETQMKGLDYISQQNNPFVSGVIGNAMEQYMAAGGSQINAMNFSAALSNVGMSSQDASIYSQIMNGDLGAFSYQAWKTGDMGNAWFDQSGRSIFERNGAVAMQVYNRWAPKVGLGDGTMTSAKFLGTQNQEILSAFENGGFYGMQRLANEKSYQASMASIGVQLKGIALSENFYWGSNAGGRWDNPSAGSAWGIEDRQLALQHQSTVANFTDQWTRMTMSNDFAVRREDNQLQRMQASQNFQNWQWSYSYNQFQQSQLWARQDWQYQDTTRSLNFGWQMEDLNEAIRFASGRERKQLMKQRDRAALSHNLEEGQIETSRERQQELWAQQEEQFQKQKQYSAELQQLDQESFAMNKEQREEFYKLDVAAYERRLKEYEEEKKLSDELRELQRKFQYDQLQLQKEAAGAQAAAAAIQKEINDAMITGQENADKLSGAVQNMFKYDNAFRIANATGEMMRMMHNLNSFKIDQLIRLIQTIGTVEPGTRWGEEREP